MTLTSFIFFLLGVTLELLWLYEAAHPTEPVALAQWRGWPPGLPKALPRAALWAAGAGGVTLALVGLGQLVGLGNLSTSLDDDWVGVIFVGLGLFLLLAGLAADWLVPRVNEDALLAVLLMGLFNLLVRPPSVGAEFLWGWGLVQGGAALYLLLKRRLGAVPLVGQAVVYLIYLFSLFIETLLRPDTTALFTAFEIAWPEAFLFGVLFAFLMLHALFLVRFFLITSSLILPANRPLLVHIIPRLVYPTPLHPGLALGLSVLLGGALALNHALGVLADPLLIGFALLAGVQALGADKIRKAENTETGRQVNR